MRPLSILNDSNVDWFFCGAKYYDRAIQILMKTLQSGTYIFVKINDGNKYQEDRRKVHQAPQRGASGTESDEVLAVKRSSACTTISWMAQDSHWDRHLNRIKSLLDVAQGDVRTSAPSFTFSMARRATYWNFSRQDYLSVCEYCEQIPPTCTRNSWNILIKA